MSGLALKHPPPLSCRGPPPPPSVETVGSVYVISCNAPEPCAPGVDPAELLCVVALRCRDALDTFTAMGRPVRVQLGLNVGPIVGAPGAWGGPGSEWLGMPPGGLMSPAATGCTGRSVIGWIGMSAHLGSVL